jgi:hypothetical protein
MILRDAIGNNVRRAEKIKLKPVTDVIQRREQRMTNSIFSSLSLVFLYIPPFFSLLFGLTLEIGAPAFSLRHISDIKTSTATRYLLRH